MRIFRIPNLWYSHWCLQNVPWSNYFGEIQIKTKICFTTSGFLVTMGCMFMELAQKKVTVCGVGLAWASGLHGILALLPFSSETFQQSMYHRRALWILWGPSLSCQQFLLPGHEITSLFPVRPHDSFQIAYWLLRSSFGSFCRVSGTSFFAPGSLLLPLQELISIDLALGVSNKAEYSQCRSPWNQLPPDVPKASRNSSQGVETLCLALGFMFCCFF